MSTSQLEAAWRSERDSMVRAVYLTCGNVHQAADIVDEAFLTVFARMRSASSIDNLRAYLWRAAFNGSIRARERENRVAEIADLVARSEPTSIGGPDQVRPYDDLAASLARLDHQTRVVLVLRFYGDFTVPQIAEHQDLPLGTVKSLLHRGIAALRSDLLPSANCEQR